MFHFSIKLKRRWLTRNKRNTVQDVPPVIREFNSLFCFGHWCRLVALITRMSDQLCKIFSMKSIENIEEVLSIWNSTLRHFCWEVTLQLLVFSHHRPEFEHCKLIVERNTNSFDLVKSKKLFLISKNFFEKIFIEHVLGRQVQLH